MEDACEAGSQETRISKESNCRSVGLHLSKTVRNHQLKIKPSRLPDFPAQFHQCIFETTFKANRLHH